LSRIGLRDREPSFPPVCGGLVYSLPEIAVIARAARLEQSKARFDAAA
jgi:hypothetical protein